MVRKRMLVFRDGIPDGSNQLQSFRHGQGTKLQGSGHEFKLRREISMSKGNPFTFSS
jgi:hypothetical protein